MKERAVMVGKSPALVGIVTEPVASAEERPACIFLNAGLVHRVGPNRLYVRLARALAGKGHRVLRLDLSGRGDTDTRRDSVSFIESSVLEIRSAMDYLENAGCRRFILLGICSGAVNALQLAMADPRVAGCVAIDGPAYPTRGYYLRRYFKRLGSVESWRNTFAGENDLGRWLRRRRGAAPAPARADEGEEFGSPFGSTRVPSRTEAEQILRQIAARGTRLFFIFTGSWTTYNYKNQFVDAFPFIRELATIRVEYFPGADHTFTRLYNQNCLIDAITAWVDERGNVPLDMPASAGRREAPAIAQ